MRCISACLIFALICAVRYSLSASNDGVTKGDQLPFSDEPLPSMTPEPIDINTTTVKKIDTEPLMLSHGTSEKVTMTNSGASVTAILKSATTSTLATGGVVYEKLYVYARQKFYFTNRTNETAGTTVNGLGGTPLETSMQWYKVDYESFENALNYRDGIFEIRSLIPVLEGKEPNKDFDLLAPYLKNITKSGSSVEMPLNLTYQFYNKYPEDVQYFAYPGAFTNETTSKETYCTTTVVRLATSDTYITKQQFDDTFGTIMNGKGEPLDTAATQKPVNDRPIVSTSGIVQMNMPSRMYPSIPGRGRF